MNHYVLYLGMVEGKHKWVANYFPAGVREIPVDDLRCFLKRFVPENTERFTGTEEERQEAIGRAKRLIGDRKYNFVSNNCEHHKNYVHNGEFRNEQAVTAASGVLLGGFGLMAAGVWLQKSKPFCWGLALVVVGGLVHRLEKKIVPCTFEWHIVRTAF